VTRPGLLFYCQHSLGLGHAVRLCALAAARSERFRVVVACGGELPDGLTAAGEVEIVALPALSATRNRTLVSRDRNLGETRRRRRKLLLETLRSVGPAAIIVELFPFGRRKFADELVPLLETARGTTPRPLVVSSVRDLLVGRGPDQHAHDTLSCVLANRYLDAVFVHSDPRFARLEESFSPAIPLRVPVHHTGFVVQERRAVGPTDGSDPRVVVSVGGGRVGAPLLRAAVAARSHLPAELRLEIVAGPFLPDAVWTELYEAVLRTPGIELHRFVPDLADKLRSAQASASQCGYNTALDLLRTGVPALVVPFVEEQEDEQTRRATRLERCGAVRMLDPAQLAPKMLAAEIEATVEFRPRRLDLDFSGAQTSAALLAGLLEGDALPEKVAV
jgi:predicted glycosyltransferase